MFWERDREKESADNKECANKRTKSSELNFLMAFFSKKGKGQSPFSLYF
jgi:hypothetical protein